MEKHVDDNELREFQGKQANKMAESLSAMRVATKADLIIVCAGKEFYTHKLILEPRSTYFASMLHGKSEDAKSGRIVLNDIEPESLDVILNFLYLDFSFVKKLVTNDQWTKILEASQSLDLEDLFQFCCSSLSKRLSPANYLSLWDTAEKHEAKPLLTAVKRYILSNDTNILTADEFMTVTFAQLKDLLDFCKSENITMDDMLNGLVLWIMHDLRAREQFITDLFAGFYASRVSNKTAKKLLKLVELKTTSEELAKQLKDLVWVK